MRVLQINTEAGWRGGERQTLYTLLGLRDAGVDCGLVCRKGSDMERAAVRDGFRVYPVPGHGLALSLATVATLLRVGGHYNLWHAQTAKAQTQALLARAVRRRPVIYTRRVNIAPHHGGKYRRTDRVVAISRAIVQQLEAVGVRDVPVIPSAVRPRNLNRARAARLRAEVAPDGRFIIGMTAAVVGHKDPMTTVRTICELSRRRRDFVFVHFGAESDEALARQLRGEIARCGLEDVYRLMGHKPNVEDFFAVFDIYLATSNEEEGLLSSVLDAFTYGVPVVSTLAGGTHDSVGDRGLTCPPREPECLASQLNRLMNDAALRDELVQRARREVREEFDVGVMTRKYLNVYREVLGR